MKKSVLFYTGLLITVLGVICAATADEGMYPISEIHKLRLKEKGLKIEISDIYNPQGISLIDGICNVGGCTGSFVSQEGLILTNHHCAYRAIQAASTAEKDYLQMGFLAGSRSEEIPARGYTVRITESYEDVSGKVLSVVREEMSLAERTKAIEQKMKEIVAEAEKQNPGKRASVSEMFTGKTYVLFIYTYLKDLRLVYAPPRSIGNFGGEVDNWMWPRHTGDFSYMRAYSAPDGSPADYSQDNVPYKPRTFLKVAPDGVNEEDFVFILGYPGRTYRHRTSHFMAYEEEFRMPYVADLYQWWIDTLEELGKEDRDVALKLASRIKGLANTMKNYRGKLLGMKRLNLVEQKRQEEEKLQSFIEADAGREKAYGTLLDEIGRVYQAMRTEAARSMALSYLMRGSFPLSTAYTLYEAGIERRKEDIERKSAYMDRNFDRTKLRIRMGLKDYYEPSDIAIFSEMLRRASTLPPRQILPPIRKRLGDGDLTGAISDFVKKSYAGTMMTDPEFILSALEMPPEKLEKIDDPLFDLVRELYPIIQELEEKGRERRGALNKLYARLLDVKQAFMKQDFIPDANGTLRLTYGYIRGYTPADAVYYKPITTVNGVLEKTTGKDPFDPPEEFLQLIRSGQFGRFCHPELNSVPTAILYNMDTTGGNSGSPILNARGELVGINFDRAYEATINDFAWNESYSRSIAVDIRYVLWITKMYGKAQYLLDEMGVE
jgi:hypothetical protein